LADLGKETPQGRDPENEVRIIAEKFPELNSAPSAHHFDLVVANMRGQEIPMIGQIQLAHGRLVEDNGELASYSAGSPVAEAYSRWQDRDYTDLEKRFARNWRISLTDADLTQRHELFTHLGIDLSQVRTLKDAHDSAQYTLAAKDKPFLAMEYALNTLHIPEQFHSQIRSRWVANKYPSLIELSPYTAFVLSVELFLEIALEKNLISSNRKSNIIDIAYLYYLPFCMLFVSSDRLHRETAPLFLQDDQQFVWGLDLKQSLGELDLFYSLYSEEEKERGIYALAPHPPKHIKTLVSDIWDRHIPTWRTTNRISAEESEVRFQEIKKRAHEIEEAEAVRTPPGFINPDSIHSTLIKRQASRRRGKWYQIPKDFREPE
jgi:hypothetical protein